MSARRALFLAPSSVTCRSCSSSRSVYPGPTKEIIRRYSSPRKLSSSDSNISTKRQASTTKSQSITSVSDLPVPKSIAAYLDEYVIGQDNAKRALAVGVFNHYLRAASNQNIIEESTRPVLYAEHAKIKKTARSKEEIEEEEILTDFMGQTKGSERWSVSANYKERPGESSLTERQSALSSDFFSSLRPEEGNKRADAKATQKTDRLMQSTSKIITGAPSNQMQRKNKVEPQMEKSNMILIGPSGSGKTHLVRTLSTFLSVPFVHVDATPLTSAGYVGEDVESIMSRLLEAADWNVEEAERGIVCIDEVDKLASPASSSSPGTIKTAGRDVGGTGVQQALLRLLEGSVVNVADKRNGSQSSMVARGSGARGAGERQAWWSPEMQALNAEHGRVATALRSGGGSGQSEALSEGRKRVGLTAGPDGTGNLKIDTSKVLFILCGAFVGLQDILASRGSTRLEEVEAEDLTGYGLIPEFVGRLPVIVTLNNLTEKDLCRILTEPRNALVTQYQSLFAAYKIKLHFTTPAIASLAHQAAKSSKTSSGARVLRRLMEKRLMDAMFDGPNGGASYALMDKSAAEGISQVQLFSRGGRSAWLNAIEEDEERHKSSQGDKKTPAKKIDPFSTIKVNSSPLNLRAPVRIGSPSSTSLLDRIDEATLRRRARARLTRPSRVGNLRILTSEG